TIPEISRVRALEIPLVPIGAEPSSSENADMAAALVGYSQRSGPDDFSALTAFLEKHPHSSWNAALLTGLGSEYYNTAHYSLARAMARLQAKVTAQQLLIFRLTALSHLPLKQVAGKLRLSLPRVYLARHRVSRLFSSEIQRLRRETE